MAREVYKLLMVISSLLILASQMRTFIKLPRCISLTYCINPVHLTALCVELSVLKLPFSIIDRKDYFLGLSVITWYVIYPITKFCLRKSNFPEYILRSLPLLFTCKPFFQKKMKFRLPKLQRYPKCPNF